MALGTGSIRFSQIVSEFGGVSPHRFSEYKSLSGLGVSGIPASGTMRFSQFRGKSNQVSTQVWVSSGYNQLGWVYKGQYAGFNPYTTAIWITNSYIMHRHGPVPSGYDGEVRRANYVQSPYYEGSWKYVRGDLFGYQNGYRAYGIKFYKWETQWIDTSAYQTQTTTARIST